jgi:hypothetical protein
LTPGPEFGAVADRHCIQSRGGIGDVRRDAVFSSTGQRIGSPENRATGGMYYFLFCQAGGAPTQTKT